MMIEVAGPAIGLEDLNALEAAIHARLAQSYRDFLSKYNGGIPTPDTIDIPGAPGMPTDVQVFFGIHRQMETSDLLWNFSLVKDRCPERRILPFACDSGGNLFCFQLDQDIASRVVYCALDSHDSALYHVAKSFEDFTKMLKPYS